VVTHDSTAASDDLEVQVPEDDSPSTATRVAAKAAVDVSVSGSDSHAADVPATPVRQAVSEQPATVAALARSADTPSAGSTTSDALTVSALVASVDPAREAYLQQFRNADPNGIYWTPATEGYTFIPQTLTEEQYRAFIADHVARTGTVGFAQTSSGSLQYTNRLTQNVAVLYGPVAAGITEPAGIHIVRPGETYVLPYPSGAVASAQFPRTGTTVNEVAVAAVGYPPFTRAPGGNVPSPLQVFINNVTQAVTQLTDNVLRAIREQLDYINAQVAEIRAQIAFNALPSAPSNAGELFRELWDRTAPDADKIVIEKVQAQRGGQERLIVYIGGTTLGNGNQGFWQNLPAYAGDTKQNQIYAINRALIGNPGAEIMLVGYSQGGLDAQNLAANRNLYGWNVTTVVTYGTPITKSPPTGYRIVHLADPFDPIPDFGARTETGQNANAGNIFERRAASTTTWNLFWDPTGMGVHSNRATYENIGWQFENDTNAKYKDIKDNMGKFEGKITRIY
jgi:hypothetical protein